jgi:hypothetical protein
VDGNCDTNPLAAVPEDAGAARFTREPAIPSSVRSNKNATNKSTTRSAPDHELRSEEPTGETSHAAFGGRSW